MGNIETTTKFSILECIFSIEDNYLEIKVADLQAFKFIEKGLQHRCFPVHIKNFLRLSILKTFICFMSFLIKLQPNLSLNSYPQKHL